MNAQLLTLFLIMLLFNIVSGAIAYFVGYGRGRRDECRDWYEDNQARRLE